MEISKELLNEVLNVKVSKIETDLKQIRAYLSNVPTESQIAILYENVWTYPNIYELAIKTKQKYPDIDLNLAATDIGEFWRQANILTKADNE